ncbi:MAG: efflux RND transporter periplasmic adaptor subunit [Gemmatimonadetes bacterium]|nr:efflux RND transporter periplasmic adaptor subunit [Gemmatimonadota bacterium]
MSGMDTQAGMEGMAGMQMNTGGPIRITTRQASLAGVTFAVASEAPLDQTVRAVAMVVPNERALGIVNVRVSGWVEKLYVNETGMHVDAGAPLFELYAPDLVTAQEELLLAKRLVSTAGGDSLVMAARRRLALWNISEQTIAEIEETGAVRRRLTIRSPYRGHVLEKNVIEGQMVRAGDRLFLIADLSTVWIEPSIFEQDIALVREGQRAAITLDALPGRDFAGRVTFIYPTLDMTTRTLRVRIEIPNPRGIIKPMMYGTVRIRTAGLRGVTVPLTAVLPTGERDVAFVLHGGAVVPTDVTVGARGDTTILVIEGLAVGDTVVASATFLFDSESSLAAAMAGIMLDMGMGLDMGGMNMGGTQMDMPDSADGGMSSDSMPGMTADTGRGR